MLEVRLACEEQSDAEMPRTVTNSLFTLYLFLCHIHTGLVWKGKKISFLLVGRAAEVNFGEQSLLMALASLTSGFPVSAWTCSSLHKLPAGTSSGFAAEKSCAASLREDHNHGARRCDTQQMPDKSH